MVYNTLFYGLTTLLLIDINIWGIRIEKNAEKT